ncbi:protein of unknown function [Pseudobutyrivibrio sp. UC1225]|uniref:DUF5050 domain-containing protein n=1 Tax=Pseudobutyrivibrio sp. UC1225 TaxID=1798185 RepID=UPI0008EDAF9D|nr:DUF5050 domain-containing protein [Pseudobutyrivibrio sp. UC1225]SFN46471.1 protein of unknown function [Pseudobutyrivibrio sp. UC1225]
MKIVRRIIIAIVALGIIAGAAYYKYINSITYFNDAGTNGNTIGNLYGNGLFCETDGVVYFANPTDYNRIYKMNPDESDIEIVANDSVYFLNADSHYVYYSRQQNRDNSQFGFLNVNVNSLCRLTKRNKKVMILDEADCNACALAGNNIIYLRFDDELLTTNLNTVKIDGTEGQQLSKLAIDPRCVVGEKLYFSGVENDHNLHSMNIYSKDIAYASAFNLWMPIIEKSNLYFIDLDSKHRICKAALGSTDKTVLTSYPAQSYNIDGLYLYYQSMKGNPDGLYRVDMASGAEELIAEGQFNNINITSKYVYFADYFSGEIYHCPVRGNAVSKFDPPILPLDD